MIFQGSTQVYPIRLTLSGTPVTGIVASVVTAKVLRTGDTAFAVKSLTQSVNWVEVGLGFYHLTLSPADLSALGPFVLLLSGTGFDSQVVQIDVNPVPLAITPAPGICVVSGNLIDIGGQPGDPALMQITFKPVTIPSQVGGTSIVSANITKTIPDALGNFSVSLLQGQVVIVEIPRAGIRNQITIPLQSSATILSLLPSLP